GRTEWTFIQFGASDMVEFSAELHGYRGNVLFGDAHVDVLDSAALRGAFAPSDGNSLNVTLALPQPEVETPLSSGSAGDRATGEASSAGRSGGGSAPDGGAGAGAAS